MLQGTWQFMSALLLQEPDKVHTIVDDLESVFWVLVYGALRRFAEPDQYLPMELFDEVKYDRAGRRLGGTTKQVYVICGNLLRLKFSARPLQKLVHECNECWSEYHMGILPRREKERTERQRSMLVSAPEPAFWLEKFASVLQDEALWQEECNIGDRKSVV